MVEPRFLAPGFESDRVAIFFIRRVTGGFVGDPNLDVSALTSRLDHESTFRPLLGIIGGDIAAGGQTF
jgi:hypothetical protein